MKSIAAPLASFLARIHGTESPVVSQSVEILCAAMAEGHVCLPLEKISAEALAELRKSNVVGGSGEFRPLILDHNNLYLSRYHQYEARLAEHLRARSEHADVPPSDETMARLETMTTDAAQKAAVVSALRRRLCIITGGPGTGKTRTAAVALSLLASQKERVRIAVAAPTGKAAARLSSSMAEILASFGLGGDLDHHLPSGAQTIHRLLGWLPGQSQFRHHAGRPLPVDVLVVDEASMIDLPLMTKLLDALHPEARLVLLGDRDQLASVEAGHVLGDICAAGIGAIRECVTELTTNHRFGKESGIHSLASAVRTGDVENTRLLLDFGSADLAARPLPSRLSDALIGPLVEGWAPVLKAKTPTEALARLNDFRILCAVREGAQGVGTLNRIAEQVLAARSLIHPRGGHYAGRPVLIHRNDHSARLYNGDLGILLPDASGELRAFFPGDDNQLRSFAPERLPEHETAFAMTVHKAQGSEFGSALVILPELDSPILTRELLYTAVTRARKRAEIWWTPAALQSALRRRVERWSGLRSRFSADVNTGAT